MTRPLPKVPRMSAAEFITLRRACGLTQQDAADLLGAAHRTLQNWEGGSRRVPREAAKGLKDADDDIRAHVSAQLEPLVHRRGKVRDPIDLVRYRTPEAYAATGAKLPFVLHDAALWRVMEGLSRLGIPYTVRWNDGVVLYVSERLHHGW